MMDGSYYPDFTAEMMAKDIELGQGLAKKHGVPMLMHGQVAQIYEMCMARYGKDSGSTIPVRLVEDACQTPLADENLRKSLQGLDIHHRDCRWQLCHRSQKH